MRAAIALTTIALVLMALALILNTPRAHAHWKPGKHNIRHAICTAFGPECAKAIRVAACESHLNPYAMSGGGLYWGMFQFGAYARARYGFVWNPWGQARAAARMVRVEGWGPWPVCGRR